MTLIDDYLVESIKYEKKYGENTIVLMQVGHFYEAYAVDNINEKINADNLEKLANIMNIQVTRKNKSIVENSRGNPIMIGVNIYSIDKYIQILLNAYFTIVLIDQVGQPPFVKREISAIYSPGTNIQYDMGDTNNIVCIYLEEIENKKNFQTNLCCGITAIDLATGKNTVYETFSRKDDFNFALDELFKFIQIYDPKELLVITKSLSLKLDKLSSYLHLGDRVVHFKNVDEGDCDTNYFQINYQNQFLSRIFKDTGLLSPIEFVGLENLPFATASYIFLLQFAYEHSESIIQALNVPNIWQIDQHLSLTNNTINQLNLIANPVINCKTKFNSLFSVINNTSTTIGKRYLRDRLLNPIIDKSILEIRYQIIEDMLTNINLSVLNGLPEFDQQNNETIKLYKLIEDKLNKVIDLERAHRRMSLDIFQPTDMFGLINSYKNIISIVELIDILDLSTLNKIQLTEEDKINLKNLHEQINRDFNLDECVKYHQDKITGNIFNVGIFNHIDEICEQIQHSHDQFNLFNVSLSKFMGAENNDMMLKLEHNERDGYYITTTNKRGVSLKSAISKEKQFILSDTIIIKNDLEFKHPTKSSTKITSSFLKEHSNRIVVKTEKLKSVAKTTFLKKISEYVDKYGSVMANLAKFIGEIDVAKSSCKTSEKYGYIRPKILDNSTSFMIAKNIRHPIIERLGNNDEYITNDIALGLKFDDSDFNLYLKEHFGDEFKLENNDSFNNSLGVLLFGTNASGKSSLMKAVGINIILAQSGHYVAASNFGFKPYTNLFTRINNNDNIFKGESSFAVEMSELRSILKRSDKNSLVLGDELCAGTESISALSIFSSSVIKLEERGSSFIFATHLHELCNIKQVTNLDRVKMFHLKVIFDMENDLLIYDRKLEKGNGPAVYGLEVCRAMKMDTSFLTLSEEIRKDLLGIKQTVLETKQSKYNSKVYIHVCEICGSDAADVHHIKFQCTADSNKLIDGSLQKDVKSNLVPLCKECHNNVHLNKITINGFKQTSQGIKLDYVDLTKVDETNIAKSSLGKDIMVGSSSRKRKFDLEQIELIKSVNDTHKLSQKAICEFLLSKHSIKLSTSTLKKIISNNY